MLEKIFCRVSFVALLLVPGLAWGEAEVIDGIAAVVNGDVITFSQVQEVASPEEQSLKQQYTGQELIDKIKETRLAVLNDLINRQLILQEFKKKEYNLRTTWWKSRSRRSSRMSSAVIVRPLCELCRHRGIR